jgi:sarcosine/dimethylglycine N-methyltransferase
VFIKHQHYHHQYPLSEVSLYRVHFHFITIMANTEQQEQEQDSIKSMQLYCNIDRIWNELRELGFSKDTKEVISVETMNQFDCYDYGGTTSLLKVFSNLDAGSHVLDIGAGLGGPARCLSHATGCSVVGVELQADVAALGNRLTSLCGMSNTVTIIPGDFTQSSVQLCTAQGPSENNTSYAAAFSILVILHIPMQERVALFQRCYDLLLPGGKLFIEDFFHQSGSEFTDSEVTLLQHEVSIPGGQLPTREEYIAQVEGVGFVDVSFEDVTQQWTDFTAGRLAVWREQRERHERLHNAATWQSLEGFYSAVVALFQGGALGGVRLTLTKPE